MKQEEIEKHIGISSKYHITFSTYKRKPIFVNAEIRNFVEKLILKIAFEKKINIICLNVLARHVHMLLDKKENQLLPNVMQFIKGITTYYFFQKYPEFKWDLKRSKIWAKGYNETRIKNKQQLHNVIIYINDKQNFYD